MLIFRKAKNYVNDFWLDVVKNGFGFFVLGALKYVASQEQIYELS